MKPQEEGHYELLTMDIESWITDDDGCSRIHIKVNGREVAAVNPVEAVGVWNTLKEVLDAQGFEQMAAFQIPNDASGLAN